MAGYATSLDVTFDSKSTEYLLRILGRHMMAAADELADMRLTGFDDQASIDRFKAYMSHNATTRERMEADND